MSMAQAAYITCDQSRRTRVRLAQRAYRDRERIKMRSKEAMIEKIQTELMMLRHLAVENHLLERAPKFALEFHKFVDSIVPTQSLYTSNSARREQGNAISRHDLTLSTSPPFQRTYIAQGFNVALSSTTARPAVTPASASKPIQAISSITDGTSIPRLLAHPPWTFSIQETSFSRRLRRSFVERGYHLLSKYDTNRDELLRSLKFRLDRFGIEGLRLRAKEFLSRSQSEQLECDKQPTTPGRLETHGVTESTTRALRLLPTSSVLENFTVTQIHVPGYEGIWLSADEVTLYLQRLGIPVQENYNSTFIQWIVPNYVVADILRNTNDTKRSRWGPTDSWFSAGRQNAMLATRTENEIPPSHSLMETGLLENTYDISTPMVAIDMSLDIIVDSMTRRSVCAASSLVIKKDDLDCIIRDAVIAWYQSEQ